MSNRTGMVLGVIGALLFTTQILQAGLQDYLKPMGDMLNKSAAPATSTATGSLSQQEMNGGLKEALAVGVKRAIEQLGREGGYLQDKSVRIPLPGVLNKAESGLRMMGQGAVVDEFITTMNRAAERAVPSRFDIRRRHS